MESLWVFVSSEDESYLVQSTHSQTVRHTYGQADSKTDV